MSLTPMLETIGDRFRLGEEITNGELVANENARVYQAKDLQSGQVVAIKILISGSSRAEEFRSRFQRDAEIMRSFDHPHVVRTIASGITPEGQPYFAMEYLDGQTLASRLAELGPIGPSEMADYLEQVASALDAAHARGIVHRDINPGAVMIQSDAGGTTSAKLLDFGLAKDLAKRAETQVEFTSKQTSLGSAAYLSPEQAKGSEIDGRSDVYSLGVTLYEALTGRLPFEGETDFQILLAQIKGTIPPFPVDWSDHQNASKIEAVVLKALSKDPADRPATAGHFSKLFQEALGSRPARKLGITWPVLAAAAILITSLVSLAKWLL